MASRGHLEMADIAVVCIDGLEASAPRAATPAHTVDAVQPPASPPSPVATGPEPAFFSTGSEVMDDILEHSQLRMLEALAHLSKRIDGVSGPRQLSGSHQLVSADMG